MIKSQLIEKASQRFPDIPEKSLADSINTLIDEMGYSLETSSRIEVRGFGSFSLHYRPPRKAHNPKTGEKLVTEPKYAVHFKPGKDMRERINASKHLPIQEVDSKDRQEDA